MRRIGWLGLVMVMGLLWVGGGHFAATQAQEEAPCNYPEGYLDNLLKDLTDTGENIGKVDTTDPAALGLAYVQMYQLRHRYENMIPQLPDCAMRGHAIFTNILGNWEDILGLALATHAHPEASDQYIAEIDVLNQRILFFTPLLLEEFFPPVPPTPAPPTETPIPVLSTFYVNTQGLNVRLGPGSDFQSVGVITGGTPIEVIALDTLDSGDVWYEIIFPESPTGRGWVFGAMISPEVPPDYPQPLPTNALPTPTPAP